MRFRAKPIDFEAGGKGVVILNREDVAAMGIHALDRVVLRKAGKELIAIVDITEKFANVGEVVTNDEVNRFFRLRPGDELEIKPAMAPESVRYIKQKVAGIRLTANKMFAIVRDVVKKRLSDTELSAFISALNIHGMSIDEAQYLSEAMYKTGRVLRIPGKPVVDKHSIGGICGDKTSLLAVPIIAAAGLIIPKTSSRAITSPAGTADRMEVLAPVSLSADEIIKIVKKTKGCLTWGGALDLAPADDAFIQIEYPLGIDPLLLPSIMSKKKAVGAEHIVIDIPTGRGAKIKTIGQAHDIAEDFIELGKRLNMRIACAVTFGEQPLGYAIGPALEAREALLALAGKGPPDLIEKVTQVVGVLFELVGANTRPGKAAALRYLKTGKANRKMREIIAAQGGDPKIRPQDIAIGEKRARIRADRDGRVLWVKNAEIAAIAREAGAPRAPGAGILLGPKMGVPVRKGETLFTIFSDTTIKLNAALRLAQEYQPIIVGKQFEEKMLLDRIPTKIPHRKIFILER
jgi:AMP phosphorylase